MVIMAKIVNYIVYKVQYVNKEDQAQSASLK